jgi:hypothetical protein
MFKNIICYSFKNILSFGLQLMFNTLPGNTKGGSITVQLTSCLTGLY